MKTLYQITFILLISVSLIHTQTFNSLISQVEDSKPEHRTALVESFLSSLASCPILENDTTAIFIYYGEANSVTLAGDMNNWNAEETPLSKLSTTNLWYTNQKFPAEARLDYKFVIDGRNWINDTRNPLTCAGGFGSNSELRMPEYLPTNLINYVDSIPHGNLSDEILIPSVILGDSRAVKVYTPPGYLASADSFPVVLFHDGYDYINLASITNILDNLIATKTIAPVVGVFSPAGTNRNDEYAGSSISTYSSFIVNELMDFIDRNYRIRKDPKFRSTIGVSNGGNISLYLGLNYPDIFGNIGAYSSNVINSVLDGFSKKPKLELKIYLDIGIYDIPQLIPLVRNLKTVLDTKGYQMIYNEFNEGHSWGNWRAHLHIALRFFFPASINQE